MKNLIVNLKGGTGNQLFQIAAGLSLAKINSKFCKYTSQEISNNKYKRKIEILPLLKELSISEKNTYFNQNIIYLDQYDIDHPIYYSNNSPLSKLENDIQIEGYFTNYRLHDDKVIRQIKSYINGIELIKEYKSHGYISVHIRELHGSGSNEIRGNIDCLDITYYEKCLDEIIKYDPDRKIRNVIVFCDMWKNLKKSTLLPKLKGLLKNRGFKYINGDNNINSSMELLNIFSNSKFSIISNSTLSWWGAYLSDGIVFCPIMNLWEPDLKTLDHWKQIYSNEIMPKTHHLKSIYDTSILKDKEGYEKMYNLRRIKVIKFTRAISSKLISITIFNKFKRWLRSIGILPENSYTTFV